MSRPRKIVPGCFWQLNRRCAQRLFLLRPDEETSNAFTYCLAEAANRFGIEVILPVAMSNHHHTVLYDPHGYIIEFAERFHRHLAKCQNARFGRWENLWSCAPPCLVLLAEPGDVIDKLVYGATNPVKDFMVERVHHWPGVNGFTALVNGRRLEARRPARFFRKNSKLPATVSLELKIPRQLGDRDEVIGILRARVAAVEAEHDELRRSTGRRVFGRRNVLRQSWRDSPDSVEPRRELRPRFAARDQDVRMKLLLEDRAFQIAYRAAYLLRMADNSVPFPVGTYRRRPPPPAGAIALAG
jgi:putative transposase